MPIVFTIDRGEEFGGRYLLKLIELRKLLSSVSCSIIQNHAASPQKNANVERSHRTDDEEFYFPRLLSIPSKKDFFLEAMNYLYYYNVVRKHSSLQRRSPWEHLVGAFPDLDAKFRFVPHILLDNDPVQLGDWSGYHRLASYPTLWNPTVILQETNPSKSNLNTMLNVIIIVGYSTTACCESRKINL